MEKHWAKWATVLASMALLLMTSFSVEGQVPTGTILGAVKDASGASVPGADVTIRNEDTAMTRQATTGDDGDYQIPALPVGHYSVTFAKTGFAEQTQRGFVLEVDQKIVANAFLQVGASAEVVSVTGEAPLVNTTQVRWAELWMNGRLPTFR